MVVSRQAAKQTAVQKLRESLERYRNSSGDSGVYAYRIGPSFIVVEFKNRRGYLYDYSVPGPGHVEAMKRLAQSGDDLATYINQNVRENYAKRLW